MPVNDLTKEGEKKQNKQRVLLISMLMGLHSSAVGFSCGHTAARDLGQASERKKKKEKKKPVWSILHIWNRPRNDSSCVKASFCQSNQLLGKRSAQFDSRHDSHDGAAKLGKTR